MAEHRLPPLPSPDEATRDLLHVVRPGGAGFWGAVLVLGVLAVIGLLALVILLAGGPEPRAKWGYAAAVLAFLLSTSHAAPLLALATRLAKGFWGIPIRRAAELHAVAGIVTTPLFIVVLFQLPEWQGRPTIWTNWPGAPQLWDSVAMVILTLTGLGLLYLASLPDLAAARDAGRRGLFGQLALGWTGTVRQWQILSGGIVVLGIFYLMFFVFVHVLISSDLAMSLVPGWKSSLMPPYHAVSAIQAGIATTVLTLALLRRYGGLERYLGLDPFWGAAKLLLALSLLFFYFTWSELLLTWYGRTPAEQAVLALLMFQPYLGLFVLSFLLNFVLPFLLLIWNPIRVSIAGPTFVALLVLVGNLVDRVRIYVASWSVAGPPGQVLTVETLPPTQYPGPLDLLIMLGAISAVALLYILALRFVPAISLWEYKLGHLLKIEQPYLRTEVAVLAKPN
ncbi:MAG: hypothetical protein GEU73_16935 [Chloroflexi bacterium]|nr:hypothetical protein [Chloroflexota bacterium]